MSFSKKLWMVGLVVGLAATAAAAGVSGASALEFTRRAVAFGPRPPGSAADIALQNYIIAELKKDGCEIIEDAFTAKTPQGMIAMKNIIAKFPGKGPARRAIAITGHFDTKYFPGRKFVGASDGGSSTGLLLELARVLAHQPRIDDVYLAFFDGEEAFGEWSDTDSLYGSRHLAARWRQDGTLQRLKALINVDMIGDKNLDIPRETNGNAALNKLVWSTAADLGYKAFFIDQQIGEDDDHMPFVRAGVPAIDLIDINYPPWHNDTDTMDKLSAQSLEIVGTVVYEVIQRLEHQ
ncbi:MAG TPA: M28 family peptidase [Bryobacteraceae bacterium]|nr:M28 family peptidase [Bryobacteraceae bacterium]